ncbi:ABSCISIC ACID-INSENSITIVE 5-like protein 3 [Morus notabilis]|uniref:ABSCISIC ACID-INSENSITIVE 5-like protein 3 n=1 Tax=Morus notabilis TaxID=981085 RepID=UPI000CED2220|nr:ABSCISIC ACID-INSENSITIVE 5-like protein 3 [Morus notabilis]
MVSPNGAQSLSLETFQGKPSNFHNVRFIELLKDEISIEEMQFHHNPSSCPSSSSSSSSSSSASHLFANFDSSGALSMRTFEDDKQSVQIQQQLISTLGDTDVIENFLARSGVENLSAIPDYVQPVVPNDPMIAASQQADWLQFQLASVQQQQQQQQQMTMVDSGYCPVSEYESSVLDVGYSDQSKLCTSMPEFPLTSLDYQAAEKRSRLCSDDLTEKNIEKKQKRMIKNRESAARSRARKQEIMEIHDLPRSQNNNVLDFKYQLRRTSSATF